MIPILRSTHRLRRRADRDSAEHHLYLEAYRSRAHRDLPLAMSNRRQRGAAMWVMRMSLCGRQGETPLTNLLDGLHHHQTSPNHRRVVVGARRCRRFSMLCVSPPRKRSSEGDPRVDSRSRYPIDMVLIPWFSSGTNLFSVARSFISQERG